jgi:hypothetical protein
VKALRELRRFILIKCAEGNVSDVRSVVNENAKRVASAFNVPVPNLLLAVQSVKDDKALAMKLLETIIGTEMFLRQKRREYRARMAQASADAIGSMATWDGETVRIDLVSLLSSALTRRNDLLVFAGDTLTNAVKQSFLFALARLKRTDMTAYVDAAALHVRWETGGLNLLSQPNPKAERVVVPLPALPQVVVAA